MFRKLKNLISDANKSTDYFLTTPMHLYLLRTLNIQTKINKISSKIYSRYPFLKDSLCKNKFQRLIALWITLIIFMIVCLILGETVNPLLLFGTIPYWDYSAFFGKCEGATNKIWAYYVLIVMVAAIDSMFNIIFKRFIIGNAEDEIAINKILRWTINIYICAICNSLLTPIAIWYAYNPVDNNAGVYKYFSLSGLILMIFVVVMMIMFEEVFENIGAIYFSILAFKVFCWSGLDYVFMFFIVMINYILHYELFKDTNAAMCFILVVLIQLVIDRVKKLKIYKQFIRLLKFLSITPGGMICFYNGASIIVLIYIFIIYVTKVIL